MFLDKQLCEDFKEALDSSPIIFGSEKYNDSLLYAVHDRIQSCVEFLNSHDEIPTKEPDFILFLVYCCMVKDAITQLFNDIELEYPFRSCESAECRKYFLDVCTDEPLNLTESEYKNDDKFFEYFRSLAFAHPFETDRHKWIQGDAKQYSPWVIVFQEYYAFCDEEYKVGVEIYSDKYPEDDENHGIKSIEIPFDVLKDYVASRYNLLQKATEWIYSEVERVKNEWRKRKVKRDGSPIEVLGDIRDILITRSENTDELETIIKDLLLELNVNENLDAVTAYRNAIIDIIPALSDAIDEIDIERFINTCKKVTGARSKNALNVRYQLEKIFNNLTDYHMGDSYHMWGLQMADEFGQGFAKDYVTINTYEMSNDEIHLLVRTACYLEYQSQRQKAKVNA